MPDIRSPYFFDRTQQAIDRYASPEAARLDFESNAPRANAEYIDHYRALTGDYFADPWEDQIAKSTRAMTELATTTNSGIATGAIGGPRVVVAPRQITPQGGVGPASLEPRRGDVATLQSGDVRGAFDTQAVADPFSFALRKLQLPTTDEPLATAPRRRPFDMASAVASGATSVLDQSQEPTTKFEDVQRRRANAAGSAAATLYSEFRKEKASDILRPPIISGQALEYDLEGKPIAGNVLHHKLYDDPRFQSLLHANPKQAANLYRAITDRDLVTDIHMTGGQTASMIKADQALIDDFNKNEGTFDPDTGKPVMNKLVEDKLNPGTYKTVQVPVGHAMEAVLKRRGMYEGRTGVALPGLSKVPQGVTPAMEAEYREKKSKLRMQFPSLTERQLDLKTREDLYGVKASEGPAWWEKPEIAAGTFGRAFDRVATGVTNKAVVDPINQALRYWGPNTPQIPRMSPLPQDLSVTDKLGDLFYGITDAADFSLKDYIEGKLDPTGEVRRRAKQPR